MAISSKHTPTNDARQTASIMAGKIIALIATFSMPLFLTRYLSKYEYGVFSQFYVVINFATQIFNLGIQSNLYFFYPKASESERKSLIVNTIVLLLIFTVIAISLLNIPFLGKLLVGKGDLYQYILFISLGILFWLPEVLSEPLYVAKIDNLTSVFYPPAVVLARLSLVIGLALVWDSLMGVLMGIVLAGLICFVFVMVYALKGIGISGIRRYFSPALAKKQLKYSSPFGGAIILNTLASQFDKIICISFLSPDDFAIYAVAFYGIPGVTQLYQSLSQVYMMKMADRHHENNISAISEIYRTLVTKTYSFSIPAILVVTLYAKRIITLFFTDKYLDAVPLFRIYIFSFLIYMLGAGLILRATDNTMKSLKVYLFSSFLTLPMTYFLIRNYGIWGGMISAMVSIILPKTLQLRQEMKLIGSSFIAFFPWKKFMVIGTISITCLIPFGIAEYYFSYGNGVMLLLAAAYVGLVSILEMKYDVFVFDTDSVMGKLTRIVERTGLPRFFKTK